MYVCMYVCIYRGVILPTSRYRGVPAFFRLTAGACLRSHALIFTAPARAYLPSYCACTKHVKARALLDAHQKGMR